MANVPWVEAHALLRGSSTPPPLMPFNPRNTHPLPLFPQPSGPATSASYLGAWALLTWARAKRERTAFSEAPMYLSSSSGPLTLKKLSRPQAVAAARARAVLPHPGGP